MDSRRLVESLNGRPINKAGATSWSGFFVGSIQVENVQVQGDAIRFDMIVPTAENDIDDYIWGTERAAGTTDKVTLAQSGSGLANARIVGIEREGPEPRLDLGWKDAPSHQYRLTFEVPMNSLHAREPVEVHIRWRAADIATATSPSVA